MPPSRSDRQLLIVTLSFLLVAAVLAVGAIWLATARDSGDEGPFYIGVRGALEKSIRDASPLYFANPTAGDGFWLDLEDGALVALVLDRPGEKDCVVKWKEQRRAYVDCHGDELQSADLDRYLVTIGPRGGSPKGSVYVDLRKTSPAPEGAADAA